MPRFFPQELITNRKVSGLEVRVYDTGRAVVSGETLSELKSPDAQVRVPVPAFRILHPSRGVVLFDAGLASDLADLRPEDAARSSEFGVPFKMQPGQDLVSQLEKDGG
ncbi:MAG: hypothetical protein WC881_04175, partial [Elusimicrobiota bacterium]